MQDTKPGQGDSKPTLSWSQPQKSSASSSSPTHKPATPPMTSSMKMSGGQSNTSKYVGIFIVGLIVGIAAGWGITAAHNGSAPTAMSTSTSETSSSSMAANDDQTGSMTNTAANTTADQTASNTQSASMSGSDMTGNSEIGMTIPSPQAAGLTVSVAQASVSAPTWLVVYEDNNGAPGNALGAGLFTPAGDTSGTIELLRGTTPGKTYFVGESLDDGDKIFSLQLDKPVRDAQGNPVLMQFTTN